MKGDILLNEGITVYAFICLDNAGSVLKNAAYGLRTFVSHRQVHLRTPSKYKQWLVNSLQLVYSVHCAVYITCVKIASSVFGNGIKIILKY